MFKLESAKAVKPSSVKLHEIRKNWDVNGTPSGLVTSVRSSIDVVLSHVSVSLRELKVKVMLGCEVAYALSSSVAVLRQRADTLAQ